MKRALEVPDHNQQLVKWDNYFFRVCQTIAENSSCLSRKIGAVMVRDKSIVSTGYNGPPRGVMKCDQRWMVDKEMCDKAGFNQEDVPEHVIGMCPRYVEEMGFKSGQGLEWCVAGHAERNCLINSARMGISTYGATMYMNCGIPCTPCLVEIINAGVRKIVCTEKTTYDLSAYYISEYSDLIIRTYDEI